MPETWVKILDFLLSIDIFWIYFFVFLYAFVEVVFPPFPGDILVILAGILIKTRNLSFLTVYLFSVPGAYFPAMLVFSLGYFGADFILNHKWVKYVIPEKRKEQIFGWLNRHSIWSLTISRFLPAIRSGIVLMAGMFRVPWLGASIFLFLSIALYNIILILLGYFLGQNIDALVGVWQWISRGLLGLTILLVLLGVVVYFYKRKKRSIS